MKESTVDQTDQPAGCEEVVEERERRQLLWLLVEFYRVNLCSNIHGRLPGFAPPVVITGTREDHRPDLTCTQPDSDRTPMLVDVVTRASLSNSRLTSRWSLFADAANKWNAEFYLVASDSIVAEMVKRRVEAMEIGLVRVIVFGRA